MKLIAQNPKATLTGLATALAVVIVWILSLFGIVVPEAVSIAIGVILVFLLGRFTRINKDEAELIKEQ